ncbi:MAG: response regulator [Hyphomicrobiaceae bacterium]
MTGAPITADRGETYGTVVVFKDITTERRMLDEIREQTAAAQRMAADLGEAHKRKDEFLATLAHELRNPLAPVRLASQMLRAADGDAGKIDAVADMLERQVTQLSRLVDDLLDVSNITRGNFLLRKANIDLESAATLAVESIQPAIDKADQRLIIEMPEHPVYLYADQTRIAQLIGNLLNNASKFSSAGATIKLTLAAAGDFAEIRVTDEGIGFEPCHAMQIFNLFYQVDKSLGRQQSGSGIGLTIANRIATMHGGAMFAESAGLRRGATFVAKLPVTDQEPLPPEEMPELPEGVRRFLVVDDNVDAASALSALLGILGFETSVVHDGPQAISEAENFQPDIILLDIGLPTLDGYKTCRAIRERCWGRNLKIVALTGWGREEDRTRAFEAGFDAHLVKPVSHAELWRVAARLFTSTERATI